MNAKIYFDNLIKKINEIIAIDSHGKKDDFFSGMDKAVRMIYNANKSGNKLMFIGNGASAAISSHMSVDFWKNVGVKALAFNDSSLLTCIGNDYGYKYIFEKPIEMFADKNDILIAISSSGKSENVLKGTKAAKDKRCKVITLSGFDPDNPLSRLGDINFYVPDSDYGPVEVLHQAIIHCLADMVMAHKKGIK